MRNICVSVCNRLNNMKIWTLKVCNHKVKAAQVVGELFIMGTVTVDSLISSYKNYCVLFDWYVTDLIWIFLHVCLHICHQIFIPIIFLCVHTYTLLQFFERHEIKQNQTKSPALLKLLMDDLLNCSNKSYITLQSKCGKNHLTFSLTV